MAQRTRQGLQRGTFQGTRQDTLKGRPEKISPLETQFRSAQSDAERFEFLLEEVGNLWASLRGGGSSKKTRHPDMRLGQCLDQKGRVIGVYDSVEGLITGGEITSSFSTIAASFSILESNEKKIFLPAQVFHFDPAVTNPAVWDYNVGATRNASINIPTGSANVNLWTSAKIPASWAGKIVTQRVHYALVTAPLTTSVVRIGNACYGYASGDGLTSPTLLWNENNDADLSFDSTETYYYTAQSELTTTVTVQDYNQIRVAFVRGDAAYTYTGTLRFFALELSVP